MLVETAAAALLLAGCSAPAAPPPDSPAPSEETSGTLATYGGAAALVPGDPCAGVTAEQVLDALGGGPETTMAWAPGQRLPGTSEVADEHGCRHGSGDVTASAWVFAAPTSPAQARRLAAEATGPRCRRTLDVESFGEPGVGYRCDHGSRGPVTGMRGLVGTSWVSCENRGTDDDQRVAEWCSAVP